MKFSVLRAMSSQQRTCINGDSSGEERTKGSNGPVGAPPEARTSSSSSSSSSPISPSRSLFRVAGGGGGGGEGRGLSWRRWSCWERGRTWEDVVGGLGRIGDRRGANWTKQKRKWRRRRSRASEIP